MRRTAYNSNGELYTQLVLIGILLVAGLSWAVTRNKASDVVTATVTDKGIKPDKNGAGTYMIYTNIETFEDTDELLQGKYNSSDIYGQIQVGRAYQFKVVGYRNDFMSMYRNVITATPVN